ALYQMIEPEERLLEGTRGVCDGIRYRPGGAGQRDDGLVETGLVEGLLQRAVRVAVGARLEQGGEGLERLRESDVFHDTPMKRGLTAREGDLSAPPRGGSDRVLDDVALRGGQVRRHEAEATRLVASKHHPDDVFVDITEGVVAIAARSD